MRQPPHTRTLRPSAREVTVYAGEAAWAANEHCKRSSTCCLLPPDTDPATLDWSALRGRTVVVKLRGALPAERETALARALLRAGVRAAMVLEDARVLLARTPDEALFGLELPGEGARVYAR